MRSICAAHPSRQCRQEHEEHLRGTAKPMQTGTAPSGQGTFIKHNYTQDDYNRMVVDLDEEDN